MAGNKERKLHNKAAIASISLIAVASIGCSVYLLAGMRLWLLLFYLALLALAIIGAVYLLINSRTKSELMDELQLAKSRVQQIELQKRQEQLNALQSQINPHFLYNTLDTIRGLAIEKDSAEVADLVAALASMFKYSMDYASTVVTLGDELSHLEKYLQIQSMRFPGKFTVQQIYECDPEALYQVSLPKMTLQPILENALSHGLKNKHSGGNISIRHIQSDLAFRIIVSDNGCGIRETVVNNLNNTFRNNMPEDDTANMASNGIALKNIDLRTKMYCGQQYGLNINSTLGLGTDVTVTLPISETLQ